MLIWRETVALIREISRNRKRAVAILGDLQGPKIRTGMMRGDVMTLTDGESVVITTAEVLGENGFIPTTYKALPQDVSRATGFFSTMACWNCRSKRSPARKCIAVCWSAAS